MQLQWVWQSSLQTDDGFERVGEVHSRGVKHDSLGIVERNRFCFKTAVCLEIAKSVYGSVPCGGQEGIQEMCQDHRTSKQA